ncbi:FAD-dependent oxidoreductase [Streptomyces sp. NPDC004609]|uniref:FAD-dependent oxidoreductase n=1 Tax=Streptomyces sp. NPDC004609 TaxID=3364704 RepID=UPI0036AAE71C
MTRPAPARPSARPRRTVVIGGGMAGMLAAAVLSGHADEVTVVERDTLPAGPEPRTSLPQARHVHVLWSGGARAFEELLPGITDRRPAAGARRIPLPAGLVSLTAHGWVRRRPHEMQYMIVCTRDLLDWVVREHVLRLPGIRLRQRHELLGPAGDGWVMGVRVRTPEGAEPSLDADLVVDTGGRGSRATDWLGALGFGGIEVAEVDSGLVYASPLYRAPDGGEGFPLVNVQADRASRCRAGRRRSFRWRTGAGWSPSRAPGAVIPRRIRRIPSGSRARCATRSSAS